MNLLQSKRRDFIPCKYLVRSGITTVLPLCAFLIAKSLRSINFFNAIDSASEIFFQLSGNYTNSKWRNQYLFFFISFQTLYCPYITIQIV